MPVEPEKKASPATGTAAPDQRGLVKPPCWRIYYSNGEKTFLVDDAAKRMIVVVEKKGNAKQA